MMAEAPKIETPHIRVTYADGRRVSVKTDNPDMVFYDIERAKRKWPAGQDAPMLWVNYLAFSKLRRTGELEKGLSFEDWLLTTSVIENLDDDGELAQELATVGPTQEVPESD
jgi:hypothetical protein